MCYNDIKMVTHFEFIKDLAKAMIEPHLRRRLTIPILRLGQDTTETIKKMLGENVKRAQEEVPNDKMDKRKTCSKRPTQNSVQVNCVYCSHLLRVQPESLH